MKKWCSFLVLVFLASGCGGSGSSDTSNDTPDTPDEPAATEWTEQTLSWTGTPEPVTSTCTIIVGEYYRMYFTGPGGILTATSTDGLSWAAPVATGVADIGATNPSVIALGDGTYVMIYGIQTTIPVTERLYRATSNDGITFTKQLGAEAGGAVLVEDAGGTDFVSVPDLISIGAATLRMYFVYSTVDSRIHTATSEDNGRTWTDEGEITLTGSVGGQTNDPDIIQLSDGSYRLFFTTPPVGTSIGDLRIRAAVSTDGRGFTVESDDVQDPSGSATSLLDPDVVQMPGSTKYLLYYGTEPAGSLHALLSP